MTSDLLLLDLVAVFHLQIVKHMLLCDLPYTTGERITSSGGDVP